ncbi:hypothetical protein [Dyadobacter sediminis]|uniref:Uncharacterized protein n=1 Tax=Dyadobacter sediminis TaxID=1493691 RepID=A0A5R9K5P0_9BACT|nr:hypothetical protein [Dyadobacter sediminis]TLU88976.1 hypothetical protein FEM55_23080 [Dyadobacter sediminis]GGC15859.1 hypothetical protein GCM10011325_48330 [Dyadobacter sediminis]
MIDDINNTEDLLDDGIDKSLRELGFIFPKTVSDFCQLQLDLDAARNDLPERIKDPYVFLHRTIVGKKSLNSVIEMRPDYSQNFAQAAREGREITEEIRKKMVQDKLKSSQRKKSEG